MRSDVKSQLTWNDVKWDEQYPGHHSWEDFAQNMRNSAKLTPNVQIREQNEK